MVIADVDAQAGEAAAAALRADGHAALAAVADVREVSELAATSAMVLERFGRIDSWPPTRGSIR